MARATKKDAEKRGAKGAAKQMDLSLVPVGNSDQPVFSNCCHIHVAPGYDAMARLHQRAGRAGAPRGGMKGSNTFG